jgi:thiamine biosynthesis protein ThiC
MPTPKHTHIVSSTPSRTRLRVSPKRRNHQEMARIANTLKTHPDVHEVRTNIQTGSIVVHHAEKHSSLEDMKAALQDLGVVLGSITDVEVPLMNGKSAVASDITSAIKDLNQRVGQTTDGVVDLRFLMPLGLGTLAIYQLLQKGWQFETVPWYVLAWYSFDSFIKLHYTAEPTTTADNNQIGREGQ